MQLGNRSYCVWLSVIAVSGRLLLIEYLFTDCFFHWQAGSEPVILISEVYTEKSQNAHYQTRTPHENLDDAHQRMSRHFAGQPNGTVCLFPWEPRVGRTVRPDVAADRVALRFPLLYDVGSNLQSSDFL